VVCVGGGAPVGGVCICVGAMESIRIEYSYNPVVTMLFFCV